MAIKKWHHLAGAVDSFKISHLEEGIERLEKSLQDNIHDEVLKKSMMEKKDSLWFLYRAKEQARQ